MKFSKFGLFLFLILPVFIAIFLYLRNELDNNFGQISRPLTSVTGLLSFADSDWSDNNFDSQTNIDASNSPGQIFLKNDPSSMVSVFSVAKNIYDMIVYNDKLIISSCTSLYLTSDAFVHSYDYLTNNITQIYSYAEGLKEQGIDKLFVFNNKLYVAGADRDDGGWDLGAIYIYDGINWTRKLTVPNAVHVLDLAYYKNKLYAYYSYNAQAMRVYESIDDGDSWVLSNSGMTDSVYARYLALYNNKLAVLGDITDRLWTYDGANWQKNENFPQLSMPLSAKIVFNGKLYWGGYIKTGASFVSGMHYTSDLATAGSIAYFNGKTIADFAIYDGKLFTVESTAGGVYKLHYSSDGLNWSGYSQQLTAGSGSRSALQSYHGRLYYSVANNVYVSSAASSGNLVSKPINLAPGNVIIDWSGLVPSGTTMKFQIRSAQTSAGLASKTFIGPDGTSGTYYETSGTAINSVHNSDSWLQYKTFMTTTNSKFTPYLDSITLTSAGVADTTPPQRSNSQPTGALSAGTAQTNISLTTNENATCKYSTTANTAYGSMSNTFSTTGAVSHIKSVSGLSNGNTYNYYARCQDTAGNANIDDYAITFSVASPLPQAPTSTSFTLTSANQNYIVQDKANVLTLSGSNFDSSASFKLSFIQNTTAVSTFTFQPKDSSTLEINITSAQINILPMGFYDIKIERTTDSAVQTFAKQILVTTVGDLWSSTATESSEQKRDGKVNIFDVSRLLSKWGSSQAADLAEADINAGPNNISAGKIDLYDANKLMANWKP